jgi:cytochrome c peroxidase
MKKAAVVALFTALLLVCGWSLCPSLPDTCLGATAEHHRSPMDLAVLPGGERVLTANHTADSISLVDVCRGRVLAEQPCGGRPVAVACSPTGKLGAVSSLWSGTISFFEIQEHTLRPAGSLRVGPAPRGLVFAPDGKILYVAVAGADEVLAVEVGSRKICRSWPAPREPRYLALSSDGKLLAAASSRSGQVRCWDTKAGRLLWERKIEDAFNLTGLVFTATARELICTHVVHRDFPVTRENIGKGWVIDSRLTMLSVKPEASPSASQIALDARGQAVGDPHGGALSGDGKWLVLAGAGTHELLMLEAVEIPWTAGEPGDFIDPELLDGEHKMRRVPLGGRPMRVAFLKEEAQVVVANYLLDAVQVVDAKAGKIVRSIPLGSPARPSLARQGEELFYDARRSHNQWFSCHTCHTDGHTCGLTFDTLNDDSFGNPKLTPTLRNVANTGPWTWHGWQRDLGAAVEKSLTETMFGPRPTPAQTRVMVAFLATLEHPPNPKRDRGGALTPAAERGRQLFSGKAACSRCHQGKHYTSRKNYDVKLEPDGSPYKLWNPPSLLGLYDRGPYLHDGRASSLKDVLQKYHSPEKLGGAPLTPQETNDLLAFLNSL